MHLVGIISKVQHSFLNVVVQYYKVVSFNTPNYLLVTAQVTKALDGLFDRLFDGLFERQRGLRWSLNRLFDSSHHDH